MRKPYIPSFSFNRLLSNHFAVYIHPVCHPVEARWLSERHCITNMIDAEVAVNRIYGEFGTMVLLNKKVYKTPAGFLKAFRGMDIPIATGRRI